MADAFLDYLETFEKGESTPKKQISEETTQNNEISSSSGKTAKNKSSSKLKLHQKVLEHTEKKTPVSKRSEMPSVINEGFREKNTEIIEQKQSASASNAAKNEVDDVQELLKRSETYYQDEWLAKYEQAKRSSKTGYIAEKMKRGKFRLNKDHKIEILSDINVYGKSSLEILNKNYD